jgi:hypothetical protein
MKMKKSARAVTPAAFKPKSGVKTSVTNGRVHNQTANASNISSE